MTQALRCTNCERPGLVELEMKVRSVLVLTMLSCSRCEARSWLADGRPAQMQDVLKLTSGDPDFVVRTSSRSLRRTARQ